MLAIFVTLAFFSGHADPLSPAKLFIMVLFSIYAASQLLVFGKNKNYFENPISKSAFKIVLAFILVMLVA